MDFSRSNLFRLYLNPERIFPPLNTVKVPEASYTLNQILDRYDNEVLSHFLLPIQS